MRTIYFDYNATTPLDPLVRAAMEPFLGEVWGNPSSIHHVGRAARSALDDARERAAVVLRCKPGEIVFTSGGTEANNLAILGAARLLRNQGRHLITSAIEHHAVLHPMRRLAEHEGFELTVLPVDGDGRVNPADLLRALRPETVLVSLMAANNEVGTLQPVAELGALCRDRGVLFHTDAVQWFGKQPWAGVDPLHADLVSLCGHKFHGPKGVGALFIRSPLRPQPILLGGSHENERRAGTENLAAIAGLVAALETFIPKPVFDPAQLAPLTRRLAALLQRIDGVTRLAGDGPRLANTLACVVDGCDSIALLAGLDMQGICASSGSACSAGSLEPSHVVLALGHTAARAKALVRFSLGRDSTTEEVAFVGRAFAEVVRRAQRCQ